MGRISEGLIFFREFIKNPAQLGSAIPSSVFLKRRILRAADVASAAQIVELGPGNGGTTRAILAAMPANAKLLCIELNGGLFDLVSRIEDSRLTVHHGNALELPALLERYGLDNPDVVISGIPFSTIGDAAGLSVQEKVYENLRPGGRFVAYQVRDRVDKINRQFEYASRSVSWEWLCLPPIRVWRYLKTG